MFMSLMTPASIAALREHTGLSWVEAADRWRDAEPVVLFDEARQVLARPAYAWAGVTLAAAEVPRVADEMAAMVAGFGTVGADHWRARRARRRMDHEIAAVIPDLLT
jgi:fatty-acid peroxygenase